jgi:hypothetical protein
MKGNNLTKQGSAYQFLFKNENGIDCRAIVSGDDERVMLLTAIGEHAAFDKMLNSLGE